MITVTPVAATDPRLARLLDGQDVARRGEGAAPTTARYLLATGADGAPTGCCELVPAGPGVACLSRLHRVPSAADPGVERALLAAAERLAARLGAHTLTHAAPATAGLEAAGYRRIEAAPDDGPDTVRYAKRLPGPAGR